MKTFKSPVEEMTPKTSGPKTVEACENADEIMGVWYKNGAFYGPAMTDAEYAQLRREAEELLAELEAERKA